MAKIAGRWTVFKFAHIADPHLDKKIGHGAYRQQRRQDIADVWLWSCRYLVAEEVDFVIISGDLFDNSVSNVAARSVARAGLQVFESELVPVYAIWGNHDGNDSSGWALVHELEELELLEVLNYPEANPIHVPGRYAIYGIPWQGSATADVLLEKVKWLDLGVFNIVVAHCGLEGLMPLNSPETVPLDVFSELRRRGVNYFALGHVHKPYGDGCIEMPGSLETLTRQEAKWPDRGFNIVTVYDNKSVDIERVVPPRRPYIVIDTDNANLSGLPADLDGIVYTEVDLQGIDLEPIVSVKITGEANAPIDTAVLTDQVKAACPVLHVEVIDATTRDAAELSELRQDSSLRELEVEIFGELLGDEAALAMEAKELALKPDSTAEELVQLFVEDVSGIGGQ